jgi:hypothetical protein
MRQTLLTLALSFGFMMLTAQPKPPVKKPGGPLDGKIYICEIYIDAKEKKWNDDDLKFATGKFKSVLFADWEFSAAPYESTIIDSTSEKHIITFNAETKPNPKGEIMIWSGTVTGKEIEGTVELQSKKGKTMKSYTFTGAEKEKKKPVPKTPKTE